MTESSGRPRRPGNGKARTTGPSEERTIPVDSTSDAVRAQFHRQADSCAKMGSPFMARLCRLLAARLDRTTASGRAILDWPGAPGADALAMRTCAALHALVLGGNGSAADTGLATAYPPNQVGDEELGAAISAAFVAHDAAILAFIASPPQTNETARAAMSLPGFLEVARTFGLPLAPHEVGASAGLNMHWDRFHYDYAGVTWGDAAAPLRLAPELRGGPIALDGLLGLLMDESLGPERLVSDRRGADIAPVDIDDAAARLRLRAYVWADQFERAARMEAALDMAVAADSRVERADAADWVEARLAEWLAGAESGADGAAAPDSVFVLYHSVFWQYLPTDKKARIKGAMARAGAAARPERPLAWLSMEGGDIDHARIRLTTWPGGERRHLANVCYHGRWIEWLG